MLRIVLLLLSATFSFLASFAQSPPACAIYDLPQNGASITSSLNARLSWYATSTATSYDIYFWTGAVMPILPAANTASVHYDTSGLNPATTYKWAVVPKNMYGAATGCSSPVSFTTATKPAPGTGNGLLGSYYNGTGLSGRPLLLRIDTTIDFEFTYIRYPQVLSPAPGIVPGDLYSVRWTGQVQPLYSETYTFYTLSDDGVRLWVNGVKLVDNWATQNATEHSGSIALIAGQKYNIAIEYYENTGDAVTKLYWSSPSTPKIIVPKQQLYAPTDSGAAQQGAAAAMPVMSAVISPNPVKQGQLLSMQITIDKTAMADLNIIGANGNIIIKKQMDLVKGVNTKTINTTLLPRGLYLMVFFAGSKPLIMKWMVL